MDEITIRVPFEDGYLGCQCPRSDCKGYFKEQLGTGIDGNTKCHCPYCGHVAASDEFLADDTQDYLESVIGRHVQSMLVDELKKLEFDSRSSGPFGISVSLKVNSTPLPVRRYRARELETDIICENCALQYSIYGVFAFCPDCGQHNSLQILAKNLEVARKMADLAASADAELAGRLIENALEDEVSTFDGFGRELCRIHASKATNPKKAESLSLQNLARAQKQLQQLFGFDLASAVTPDDWTYGLRCFHKRHLQAHSMGVIDDEYMRYAADPTAVVGRKVTVSHEEVTKLAEILLQLAPFLARQLDTITPATSSGGTTP